MGRYPDLQPALPATVLTPSRTQRILQPSIVLVTVLLLGAMSLVGVIVAAAIFLRDGMHSKSVNATQAFALIASILSFIYIILHAVAAVCNEPVGVVRPPELRIHAACFIVARLVLVFWVITFIAACSVVSRPVVCLKGTLSCKLQVADVVTSNVAIVATGIILTALEACKYPFQVPNLFHLKKKVTCRVSSFGDDILDCSISRGPSIQHKNIYEVEKPTISHQASLEPLTEIQFISNDEPPQRPLTPLLPMAQRSRARGWGEEWTHLTKENGLERRGMTNSDSGISMSYNSSSGYISSSDESSYKSRKQRSAMTKRPGRPRVITPSSSISNLSRRSPLSTMRSAEYPDIVIRPELRFCPPSIPPPHEWNLSRTASMSQLIPMADVHALQRRSSMMMPEQLSVRRPNKDLPMIPRKPTPSRSSSVSIIRRKTSEIKVPGAFIDNATLELENTLEEHTRVIEVQAFLRTQSRREQQPGAPVRQPSIGVSRQVPNRMVSQSRVRPDLEMKIARKQIDSRSRYREQRPLVHRAHTTTGSKEERPATARPEGSGKIDLVKAQPLNRLSLGDISSGLGNIFG